MVTTAMAQIDVTKTYRIKDVASGNYLTAFNHDAHSSGAVGGVGVAELDENSKEQVFYLEPTSAGYFLRLASGDYYVIGQSWNVDALAQNGTIFNFEDAGEGNFYLKKGSTYFKTQTVDDKTYVFCDAPEDSKATWELEVVGESGYATYNTFNANKAYVIKSRERGGLTINGDATGFCSTNDAGRGTFVEHANTDNHFAVVTYEEKSYLYSVEAKKFLKADLTLTGGIGDVVAFRDASAEGASRMSIYFKEVTDANVNIGGSNQIQVNWWSAIDHGNAMLFVEVADFDPAEALAVLSNVAEVTYNFVYEGVTVATQTETVHIGEAYPDLAPALPLGYVVTGTKPQETVSGNETVTIALSIDNNEVPFAFVEDGTPTTWYYAQMHAYTTGGYSYRWFIAPAEDGTSIRTQDHEFAANETDAHLWGFVGTVEGGFKMVNKGSGDAIKSENSGVAQMSSVADATAFIAMGSEIGAGWFCMKNPAGNYLNSQGTVANATNCDFVIKHWSANDGGSSFYLTEYVDEDVTVTVSDAGWATMYLGEAVHVPAGVNAYIVTGVENGYLIKEQIAEGEAIPANTGILLENKGEYNFAKTVTYNVTFATNLLAGTLTDTEITKEEGKSYYILANGEEGIGFYNPVLGEDETKFNNAANKAYLLVPESVATEVACYSFRFGEGTTGIEEITENREQSTVIYDLIGRRVEAVTAPGIYVVNGRKVLVK